MEPLLQYSAVYLRPVRPEPRGFLPWLSLSGSVMIWFIPFVIVTGVLYFPLGPFSPLISPVLLYMGYRAIKRSRRTNGQVIVDHVDLAVRLNLPLAAYLRAAARGETGRRARQLGRIHASLASGASLPEALAAARDVPDDVIERLGAATAVGQLRPILAKSVEDERRMANEAEDVPDPALYRAYVVFMLFFVPLVVWALMVLVVPKFKEIFKDFKTTLPPLTQFIINFSSLINEDLWPLALLAVLGVIGILLVLFSYCATEVCLPWLPLPDVRRIGRWIAWRVPVLHTLQRDRSLAETCALLAASSRAGVALPEALAQAVNLPVNAGFRRRLEDFRQGLLAGQAPAEAATAARLPGLVAGLLTPTSARSPDAELFGFLESYYRNRFSRTVLLLRGATGPIIVLTFALIVGTTVVALFLPLVKLINSVAGGAEGGAL